MHDLLLFSIGFGTMIFPLVTAFVTFWFCKQKPISITENVDTTKV